MWSIEVHYGNQRKDDLMAFMDKERALNMWDEACDVAEGGDILLLKEEGVLRSEYRPVGKPSKGGYPL